MPGKLVPAGYEMVHPFKQSIRRRLRIDPATVPMVLGHISSIKWLISWRLLAVALNMALATAPVEALVHEPVGSVPVCQQNKDFLPGISYLRSRWRKRCFAFGGAVA